MRSAAAATTTPRGARAWRSWRRWARQLLGAGFWSQARSGGRSVGMGARLVCERLRRSLYGLRESDGQLPPNVSWGPLQLQRTSDAASAPDPSIESPPARATPPSVFDVRELLDSTEKPARVASSACRFTSTPARVTRANSSGLRERRHRDPSRHCGPRRRVGNVLGSRALVWHNVGLRTETTSITCKLGCERAMWRKRPLPFISRFRSAPNRKRDGHFAGCRSLSRTSPKTDGPSDTNLVRDLYHFGRAVTARPSSDRLDRRSGQGQLPAGGRSGPGGDIARDAARIPAMYRHSATPEGWSELVRPPIALGCSLVRGARSSLYRAAGRNSARTRETSGSYWTSEFVGRRAGCGLAFCAPESSGQARQRFRIVARSFGRQESCLATVPGSIPSSPIREGLGVWINHGDDDLPCPKVQADSRGKLPGRRRASEFPAHRRPPQVGASRCEGKNFGWVLTDATARAASGIQVLTRDGRGLVKGLARVTC